MVAVISVNVVMCTYFKTPWDIVTAVKTVSGRATAHDTL